MRQDVFSEYSVCELNIKSPLVRRLICGGSDAVRRRVRRWLNGNGRREAFVSSMDGMLLSRATAARSASGNFKKKSIERTNFVYSILLARLHSLL
jgi:hypothetical protein